MQVATSTVNYTGTGSVVVLTPQPSETKTNWTRGLGCATRLQMELACARSGSSTESLTGDNTANVNVLGVSIYYKF